MRSLLVAVLLAIIVPGSAGAKSHLWRFDEVFSNPDGSIQFVEMFVFDPAGTNEWILQGQLLESNAHTYVFPNNLPNENTFQRWFLAATPAFAALPGAPTPDYIIPPNFFDPAGDELRYRTVLDVLPIPGGVFPTDGILGYLRDGTTAVNTPTNFAGDVATIDASQPCNDGVDNDEDGWVDYPDDPACRHVDWLTERSQCQDGVDNDGAQGTDFDGGASIHGPGGVDPEGADPECLGKPSRDSEAPPPSSCGLGAEAAVLLGALAASRRRRRRSRPARA